MEPEARYRLVGAALLALMVAVVVTGVWLARTGARGDFHYYTIYFERQSLEGLQIGGDVNMRGVKVGRVQEYALSPDNINRVEVTIRIDRKSPVSDNTYAVVTRNILTGLARVNLVTPGTPGPPLALVRPGEDFPVIPEGSSGTEQLADAVNRLAVTGTNALDSINQTMTRENREAFAATLANLRDVSAALSKRMSRLDEVADVLTRSATEFGRSSREIAGAVDRISRDVGPLATQADATLRDLSSAVKALERDASTLARRVDEVTDTGALEIRATAQELRASAEILARAADRLQDPRAAILGPGAAQLGPGERLR